MTTNRQGRRRRQKRHKRRSLSVEWRRWSLADRGAELAEMEAFVSKWRRGIVEFRGGPFHGEVRDLGNHPSPYWVVPITRPLPQLYRDVQLGAERELAVETFTYRIQPRYESRLFYAGENRRLRRLLDIANPV